MKDTPTSAAVALSRSGAEHQFGMGFSAKRRIMRRLRALQLKGELTGDLNQVETLDNIELAYITVAECRIDDTLVPEDSFLSQFDEKTLGRVAGELWNRFASDRPQTPSPNPEVSPTNGSLTTHSDGSGHVG